MGSVHVHTGTDANSRGPWTPVVFQVTVKHLIDNGVTQVHFHIYFFIHTVDKIKYVELCECFYYWDYRLVGFNNIATAVKK